MLSTLPLAARAEGGPFPPEALKAHTVIILNDTHTMAVEEGATAELKQWGRLTVVNDLDSADIVLHFTKATSHSTSNSQTKDEKDNNTSYGFSVTSSSTIRMEATEKGGFATFYSTTTDDSKQKAGRTCAEAFISAFQDAQRLKK